MRKPPEITDDEWDTLTSPENYYCDGEVSRAEADRLFQRKVARLVASRRGSAQQTPASPHRSGDEMYPADTMVFNRVNKGYDEAQSRRLLNDLRRAHSGSNLVHALVYNGFSTQAKAEKYVVLLGGERKSAPPARTRADSIRTRGTQQPTNAAAVSRVLNSEAGGGFHVTQVSGRRVMVQNGPSSRGLKSAAKVLSDKGYVYTAGRNAIVVNGRRS